jgi:hypothetical protein
VGVPVGERAGRAPRLAPVRSPEQDACCAYKVPTLVYWPLAIGFIVFVLIAVLIGWILDPDRHGGGNDHH